MEIDKNLDLLNINNPNNFQMDGGGQDSKNVISKLKKLLQTNRIKYLRKFNNKLIYELSNSKLNSKTTLIISTKLIFQSIIIVMRLAHSTRHHLKKRLSLH